jgi:hypothetical protein
MLEFHVCVHKTLEVFISPFGKKYGGDLPFDFLLCCHSIVLIGQDECSYKFKLDYCDMWVIRGDASQRQRLWMHGGFKTEFSIL